MTERDRSIRGLTAWATKPAAIVIMAAIALMGAATALDRRTSPPSPPGRSGARGPIPAETYLWRPVAIGGGGFVTGLSMDAAGLTRVVRTDVHGAYVWDAAAARWSQMVTAAGMPATDRVQNGINQGAFEVAVAPGDARRVYLAIMDRVYRSDDAGRTWIAPTGAARFPHAFDANSEFRLYGAFMAVSPDDADLVLLGTMRDGLWRSTDAGATWTRLAEVPAGADIRPAPGVQTPGVTIWFAPRPAKDAPAPVLAASAGHGVFVARDPRGGFARLVPAGAPQPMIVARASYAADGSLFVTDPEARKAWVMRGGAWHDLTTAGLPAAAFVGIAASPQGPVYASDVGGKLWCSGDGGRRWTGESRRAAPGPNEPPWLHVADQGFFASGQIAFDPAAAGRLWVMAGIGPYRAETGAQCGNVQWRSAVRGIEELVASDVVQPPGHAPLFAAWDFGIHQKASLDTFSTGYGPKERVLIAAQQLDWSASNPAFVVTNASDTRMTCCSEDGDAVLAGYSRDGGATWRKFATLPQPPGTSAKDPWRMSFGTIAVSADSIDTIVWAPAFDRSPFYTRDRGATWHRVILRGETLPNTGSFGTIYGARKTLAADRVRPQTFYLVHSGGGANAALTGLWRTRDGGAHWQRVFAGEIAPDSSHSAKLRAVPGQAGHLFFTSGIAAGADTMLRRSRDGGAHWQAVPGIDHVDDIGFGRAAAGRRYPTLFVSGRVAGRYGVWRSIDDARSWQRLAGFPIGRLDQVSVVEGDKDVFGRVYVGYIGSGWLYGEPARCRPAAFRPRDPAECVRLPPPALRR